MAISASTATSDFSGFITPDRASAIFEMAQKRSVVQQLVPQIPLGANGVEIPVVTGKVQAGWVSEGGQKPATAGSMTLKTITPKKIAAIAVVSAEVVRANPGGYVDQFRPQIAEAFALAFDQAALHDAGPDGTATAGPFATYIDQTTNSVEVGTGLTIHNDFVSALSLVLADGYQVRGWALDDLMEPMILDELDGSNRPLYHEVITDDGIAYTRPGRILGRPSFMGDGVATNNGTTVIGYGGDWSQARWGVVGGISYDVSTQATVTINGALVSLWENNLVALRAEAEYGFLVNNTNAFVKLANVTP